MKKIVSMMVALVLVLSMVISPITTKAEETSMMAEEITAGYEGQIMSGQAGDVFYYKFVPEASGVYSFYSENNDKNVEVTIYNSTLSDTISSGNGYVNANLDKDETYYYLVKLLVDVTTPIEIRFNVYAMEITNGDSAKGYVGEVKYLGIETTPSFSSELVDWTSSDESIVTVERYGSRGRFTCVSEGTAVITATSEYWGVKANIKITVEEYPELEAGVEVSVDTQEENVWYKFIPEETGTYKLTISDNGAGRSCFLYNDKSDVITSKYAYSGSELNLREKLSAGETYLIYIYSSSMKFNLKVEQITQKATSLEITNGDSVIGFVGETKQLYTEILPEECAIEEITWASGNEGIVTVDSAGKLTYISDGTTTVTVTSENGLSDSIKVRVKSVEDISVGYDNTITFAENKEESRFKFVPSKSGKYKISVEKEGMTWVQVYDENHNYITSLSAGDDYDELTHQYEADEIYYFYITKIESGDVRLKLEETSDIAALEIVSLPKRMTYYKGADYYYSLDGMKLKATLADGTTRDWEYNEGYSTARINGYEVEITRNYNEETERNTDIIISCEGVSVQFSFNIIDPVESIEVYTGDAVKVVENVDGEDYYGDFIYSIGEEHFSAFQFKINYKDGSSTLAHMYEYVDEYRISFSSDQYEEPWDLGGENYVTVYYAGKSVRIPVEVVENPVEEIVLNSAPTKEYVLGEVAYYDGIYYEELIPAQYEGLEFTVRFKDGTEKRYSYKDISGEYGSYNDRGNGYIDGYAFSCAIANHEAVVGENLVEFSYRGFVMEYSVTVKASEVTDIEVVEGPTKTEYEEGYSPIYTGMKVQITYSDGSSKSIELTEENTSYGRSYDSSYYNYSCYCTLDDGTQIGIKDGYSSNGYKSTLLYQNVSCSFDGFTYTKQKNVELIKVINPSLDAKDMSVQVTYEDDTTEDIALDDLVTNQRYGKTSRYLCKARTEKGIVTYEVYLTKDNLGNTGYSFSFDTFEMEYEASVNSKDNATVSLTSKTNENKDITITLEGAGSYKCGEQITITAEEKLGYKFLGWFKASEDGTSYEGEALSTEYTYKFVLSEDTDLVAVYEIVETATLKINGSDFKVNDGVNQTIYNYTQAFNVGTEIKVEATADNFAYWMNDSNKIVSTEKTYTFKILQTMSITAVYNSATEGTAFVEFVSDYNEVMQAQNYDSSSKIVLPIGPSKSGHIFKNWNMTAEDILTAISEGKTYIRVTPVYEQVVAQFNITVVSDGDVENADIYQDVSGYEFKLLTAKAIAGRKFAYWSDAAANGNVLSTSETYNLYVNKNVTIYAVYVGEDESVELKPTITMTNAYASVDSEGSKKVHFEASRNIMEGYVLQEHGVLYGTDAAFGESTAENVMILGGSGVAKKVSSATGSEGIYVLNVSIGTQVDTTVYGRGYMILQDSATGESITVYSNIVSGSYNSLGGK